MSELASKEADIRAAVGQANIPILLMCLVQITGELRWLEEPYTPSRTVGMDDNETGGLSPELQQEVRSAAADAIIRSLHDGKMAIDVPNDVLAARMLSVCMGEK